MTETPLSIEDQVEIGKRLDAIGMHLSEFSYPNLFLFRNVHGYKVVRTTGGCFVSGVTYDKKRYLMPLVSPDKAGVDCFPEIKELLHSGEWDFLFPIPEEWVDCFDEENFSRSFSPNDSDYLYFTEKFKTYAGKKMHKKKNLMNQFIRNHDALLVPLTDDVKDDAKLILNRWQDSTPQELAASDYHPCMEALDRYRELKLTGAMVFAGSEPAGFILGEALNPDTFTIHFAKADTSYKGVYQFLFSRFSSDFCPNYTYINMEQDMGSEGLRKTKVSYRPDLMAKKYRVALRDGQ